MKTPLKIKPRRKPTQLIVATEGGATELVRLLEKSGFLKRGWHAVQFFSGNGWIVLLEK